MTPRPTLRDVMLAARGESSGAFEADLEDHHLASPIPQELRVFERAFRFTPVEHDPFPKPEPKKKAKS